MGLRETVVLSAVLKARQSADGCFSFVPFSRGAPLDQSYRFGIIGGKRVRNG